jgi:arylsulfatase A-like enzyme
MPHLNRLLAESVLFSGAIAPSHWTMPSHMSLFTSLHPDTHRVTTIDGTVRLSPGVPTLAEQMQQAGYLTAGFATCGFLKGDLGFERGFHRYNLRYNNASRQNLQVRDWLWDRRDRDQFIFLHYFDAHSDYRTLPYDAPSGFDALWSELAPEASFDGCAPDGSICASRYMAKLNAAGVQLDPDQRQAIALMYDRGVRQLDYRLGKLVAWLKAQGLWEASLVVLFSDHGEEFQEHGKLLHHQIYNELLEVPLIVKFPGARHGGRRIAEPVELLDIAPTILSLLNLPVPEPMQGRNLMPLIEGAAWETDGDTALFAWSAESWSVTRGEWKMILHTRSGVRALYHLGDDPGERHDLSREKPGICNNLHRLLQSRLQRNQDLARQLDTAADAPAESGFSDEERKQLEALGYVE